MENTPFNQLNGYEQTGKLTDIVKQAYYRRDRQMPANIAEIVATLKADILRAMPTVGILTIDQAIFDATNDVKVPLSPALFFTAIKNKYIPPYSQRYQDREEWTRPDTEQDTLNLLDTLAAMLSHNKAVHFNWRREYHYLVLRGQIDENAFLNYIAAAKARINTERVRDFMRPVAEWTGQQEQTLNNTAKYLAVIDWLKACNTSGRKPSQVIKINERSYQEFRKTY